MWFYENGKNENCFLDLATFTYFGIFIELSNDHQGPEV